MSLSSADSPTEYDGHTDRKVLSDAILVSVASQADSVNTAYITYILLLMPWWPTVYLTRMSDLQVQCGELGPS